MENQYKNQIDAVDYLSDWEENEMDKTARILANIKLSEMESKMKAWKISTEDYEDYFNDVKLLMEKQDSDLNNLNEEFEREKNKILLKSAQERKDGGTESVMISALKSGLYFPLWIEENTAQNNEYQNFGKWVIDELLALPEVIELITTNPQARTQIWEWIKNMSFKDVYESLKISADNAYEWWRATVFSILLLLGVWALLKTGSKLALKIAKSKSIHIAKEWWKKAFDTAKESLKKWVKESAKQADEVVEWSVKKITNDNLKLLTKVESQVHEFSQAFENGIVNSYKIQRYADWTTNVLVKVDGKFVLATVENWWIPKSNLLLKNFEERIKNEVLKMPKIQNVVKEWAKQADDVLWNWSKWGSDKMEDVLWIEKWDHWLKGSPNKWKNKLSKQSDEQLKLPKLENSRTMSLDKPWMPWDRISIPNHWEFRWSVKQNTWIWKWWKTPSEMGIKLWQDKVVSQVVKEWVNNTVKQLTHQVDEVVETWVKETIKSSSDRIKSILTQLKWWEKIVTLRDALRNTLKDLTEQLSKAKQALKEAKNELKVVKKWGDKSLIDQAKTKINDLSKTIDELSSWIRDTKKAIRAPENFIDRPIKYWLITATLLAGHLERNIRNEARNDVMIYWENEQQEKWSTENVKTANDLVREEQSIIDNLENKKIDESSNEDIKWLIDTSKEKELVDSKWLNEAYAFYRKMLASPENINQIQTKLIENGEKLAKFWKDSKFWSETFDAIKSFQAKNWLAVDWKVWTDTLKKLWLIKENQSSRDFYKNVDKVQNSKNNSEKLWKGNKVKSNSELEEITLAKDNYNNVKTVDLTKDNDDYNTDDNDAVVKYEKRILWEKITVEKDWENTVKLIIDDLQSPTIITWVPRWKEQATIEKYKESFLSILDLSDSHTYEEIIWK